MVHIRFISDIVSVLCLVSLWCIVLTWVFLFVCVCLFLVFAGLHFYCMLTTVKRKNSGYWDNKIHIWKIAQPLFWLGCLWGHLFSVIVHLCWVLLLLHYIKSTTSFTFLQWNSTICSGRPEAPEDAFSFPVPSSIFSRPCVLVLWAVSVLLTYSNGRQLFLFLVFMYSLQGFVECLHTLRFSR